MSIDFGPNGLTAIAGPLLRDINSAPGFLTVEERNHRKALLEVLNLFSFPNGRLQGPADASGLLPTNWDELNTASSGTEAWARKYTILYGNRNQRGIINWFGKNNTPELIRFLIENNHFKALRLVVNEIQKFKFDSLSEQPAPLAPATLDCLAMSRSLLEIELIRLDLPGTAIRSLQGAQRQLSCFKFNRCTGLGSTFEGGVRRVGGLGVLLENSHLTKIQIKIERLFDQDFADIADSTSLTHVGFKICGISNDAFMGLLRSTTIEHIDCRYNGGGNRASMFVNERGISGLLADMQTGPRFATLDHLRTFKIGPIRLVGGNALDEFNGNTKLRKLSINYVTPYADYSNRDRDELIAQVVRNILTTRVQSLRLVLQTAWSLTNLSSMICGENLPHIFLAQLLGLQTLTKMSLNRVTVDDIALLAQHRRVVSLELSPYIRYEEYVHRLHEYQPRAEVFTDALVELMNNSRIANLKCKRFFINERFIDAIRQNRTLVKLNVIFLPTQTPFRRQGLGGTRMDLDARGPNLQLFENLLEAATHVPTLRKLTLNIDGGAEFIFERVPTEISRVARQYSDLFAAPNFVLKIK